MKKKIICTIAMIIAFTSSASMAFTNEVDESISVNKSESEFVNLVDYYREHPEVLKKKTQPITDAKWLATITDSVAPNSDDNCKIAIMDCIKNRARTIGFPNSIEEVCAQKNQWQGYTSQSKYTNETYDLAKDFVSNIDSVRISPIDRDMVYLRVGNTGLYFRNSWENENEKYIPFYS